MTFKKPLVRLNGIFLIALYVIYCISLKEITKILGATFRNTADLSKTLYFVL